jgi:hypothetical protein
MKDQSDIDDCINILEKNFDAVQDFYMQCIAISNQYPRVDFPTFLNFVENI